MVQTALDGWDAGRARLPVHRERRQPGLPRLLRPGREPARRAALSVTEGEDKPLKYPTIFNTADVAVITKTDLAEAAGFDWDAALGNIQSVRPGMRVLGVSAKTGAGMAEYLALLEAGLLAARGAAVTGASDEPPGGVRARVLPRDAARHRSRPRHRGDDHRLPAADHGGRGHDRRSLGRGAHVDDRGGRRGHHPARLGHPAEGRALAGAVGGRDAGRARADEPDRRAPAGHRDRHAGRGPAGHGARTPPPARRLRPHPRARARARSASTRSRTRRPSPASTGGWAGSASTRRRGR